jgi:hypothetical protein
MDLGNTQKSIGFTVLVMKKERHPSVITFFYKSDDNFLQWKKVFKIN